MTQYYWTPDPDDARGEPSNLEYSQPWAEFNDIYVQTDYSEAADDIEDNPNAFLEDKPSLTFDHGRWDNARKAVFFDEFNGEPLEDSPNVEIWFRMTPHGAGGDSRALARASGNSPDSATGLTGGIRRENDRTEALRYYNGNYERLGTTGDVTGGFEVWQQRVRFNGNGIYIKAWRDVDPEPTSWTLVAHDDYLEQAGSYGYFQFDNSPDPDSEQYTRIYEIGIGTNGDWAPTGPLNREEIRHTGRINGIDTQRNRNHLAAGRGTGATDIYRINDFSLRDVIDLSDTHDTVTNSTEKSVAFSPDNEYLAISYWDTDRVRVFDTDNWDQVTTVNTYTPYALAWDPDTNWLAVGTDLNAARIYNTDDWSHETDIPMSGITRAVDFSPDGTELAVADTSGTVKTVSTNDWTTDQSSGFDNDIATVSYSPSGDWLAYGTWDNGFVVLDPATLSYEYYDYSLEGSVYSISWDPVHDWVAFGEGAPDGNRVTLLDANNWDEVDVYRTLGNIESIEFYNNGMNIAVGGRQRFEILQVLADYRGIDLNGDPVGNIELTDPTRGLDDAPVESVWINYGDGEGEQLLWGR